MKITPGKFYENKNGAVYSVVRLSTDEDGRPMVIIQEESVAGMGLPAIIGVPRESFEANFRQTGKP